MPKSLLFWTAAAWTGVIAFFCLIQLHKVPLGNVANLDKYVHVFFHFVFTLLWALFFKKQIKKADKLKPLVLSFFLSVFFGIGIEILQELCTTTRKADLFDVMANMTGAVLAVGLLFFCDRYSGSNAN